jgi:hypothetical protein
MTAFGETPIDLDAALKRAAEYAHTAREWEADMRQMAAHQGFASPWLLRFTNAADRHALAAARLERAVSRLLVLRQMREQRSLRSSASGHRSRSEQFARGALG